MIRHLAAATLLATMPALAVAESHAMAGDAAAGEKVFRKCMACHDVGADAKNKVGPILNGVIDRQIASVEGYTYSDVLNAMGARRRDRPSRDVLGGGRQRVVTV
ncbi:c-type cytochrome [Citreimonas salinaria]|uniref:Cytochrome c n=1 Tax=Citreimonas salinaria TaxID=321339 RepID=A0A1H3FIP4_9RHOB|nr:c-type cytochrome [Citreimonas salinaria]SDX90871.1 cytochrome c [Citreimonas salinaria]